MMGGAHHPDHSHHAGAAPKPAAQATSPRPSTPARCTRRYARWDRAIAPFAAASLYAPNASNWHPDAGRSRPLRRSASIGGPYVATLPLLPHKPASRRQSGRVSRPWIAADLRETKSRHAPTSCCLRVSTRRKPPPPEVVGKTRRNWQAFCNEGLTIPK
jgi:hypothetical protein